MSKNAITPGWVGELTWSRTVFLLGILVHAFLSIDNSDMINIT